jgi:glycerophosphoryl diester phosphodiesterase
VNTRRKHLLLAPFLIGAFAFAAFFYLHPAKKDNINSQVFSRHRLIGHAFGEIDGVTYTNSLEAFNANYSKGRRVFEVDFAITMDRAVVCFHEGSEGKLGLQKRVQNMTRKEFKETRLLGRYTTLDIHDVIELMKQHRDIYIVTDIKRNLQDIIYFLSIFVQEAYKADPTLLNRIIPQVYDEATYSNAMFLYPFPEVIYTLYRTNSSDEQVIDLLERNSNITGLTVSRERFNPNLAEAASDLGRVVFVHTINDPEDMESYRKRGADGFYTDSYF